MVLLLPLPSLHLLLLMLRLQLAAAAVAADTAAAAVAFAQTRKSSFGVNQTSTLKRRTRHRIFSKILGVRTILYLFANLNLANVNTCATQLMKCHRNTRFYEVFA